MNTDHLQEKVEEDRYSIFILSCNSCDSVLFRISVAANDAVGRKALLCLLASGPAAQSQPVKCWAWTRCRWLRRRWLNPAPISWETFTPLWLKAAFLRPWIRYGRRTWRDTLRNSSSTVRLASVTWLKSALCCFCSASAAGWHSWLFTRRF